MYFVTGNKNKLIEVREFFPQTQPLLLDLPEIQSLDPKEIISYKLDIAIKHCDGSVLVEDTSLAFEALNGLPGPLIKWFMQSFDLDGLYDLVDKYGNYKAIAKTILGYKEHNGSVHFYEGIVEGSIVPPRSKENSFGWDPIFQPEGSTKTFAEMTLAEKNSVSHRYKALNKLKLALSKR